MPGPSSSIRHCTIRRYLTRPVDFLILSVAADRSRIGRPPPFRPRCATQYLRTCILTSTPWVCVFLAPPPPIVRTLRLMSRPADHRFCVSYFLPSLSLYGIKRSQRYSVLYQPRGQRSAEISSPAATICDSPFSDLFFLDFDNQSPQRTDNFDPILPGDLTRSRAWHNPFEVPPPTFFFLRHLELFLRPSLLRARAPRREPFLFSRCFFHRCGPVTSVATFLPRLPLGAVTASPSSIRQPRPSSAAVVSFLPFLFALHDRGKLIGMIRLLGFHGRLPSLGFPVFGIFVRCRDSS